MLLEDGEPMLESEFVGTQNVVVAMKTWGHSPILKPREVIALLEALGFFEVRQRGSHQQLRHSDGRCTTVPCHAGCDVSPILPGPGGILPWLSSTLRLALSEQ